MNHVARKDLDAQRLPMFDVDFDLRRVDPFGEGDDLVGQNDAFNARGLSTQRQAHLAVRHVEIAGTRARVRSFGKLPRVQTLVLGPSGLGFELSLVTHESDRRSQTTAGQRECDQTARPPPLAVALKAAEMMMRLWELVEELVETELAGTFARALASRRLGRRVWRRRGAVRGRHGVDPLAIGLVDETSALHE